MAPKPDIKLDHHFATSSDGAKLSYYSVGTGDGVLILHGAFSYALLHSELADALSPYCTVHLPSRRGRGLSGPYPSSVTDLNPRHQPPVTASAEGSSDSNVMADAGSTLSLGSKTYTRTYSPAFTTAVIATEVSDLEALIEATGAIYIIGVSSGALLTLHALLQSPKSPALSKVRKVVIFEPPIFFTNRLTSCKLEKFHHFEQDLEDGDIVGAAVTAMLIVELGPGWIPRWLMKALAGMMFRGQDRDVQKKREKGEEDRGVCTMSGLAALLRYDFAVTEGMAGESGRYEALSQRGDETDEEKVEILLLSGAKTPAFLAEGMNTLRETITGAKSIVVEGVGHELLCDGEMRGQPARAVPVIREFFL
ncbi:Alpha/Beta hydrolase protein [Phialemonium atrogriseum]|uniref:Alpha/Beta hydrolase protein n=1 Tax=Phialemonium atrogriseum TaxID=1093897 RepID=A0AAJ0C7J4_9PEZI|nr:Alpha/Beta hydrolase protein [Phialemonium atrogriseum]KAK1770119.1 Alpha/Beta hydrolase protein [Phialemonium atrogriseum]